MKISVVRRGVSRASASRAGVLSLRAAAFSFFAVAFSSFVVGCASADRPTRSMIYASAALKAAERSQAEKRSPDLYRRAENALWKAQRLYLAKEYEDAQKASFEARRLAEQAELDAELKEAVSEGGSP